MGEIQKNNEALHLSSEAQLLTDSEFHVKVTKINSTVGKQVNMLCSTCVVICRLCSVKLMLIIDDISNYFEKQTHHKN